MNIRLLGTGAADGIPGFYGSDRISLFARENGGKDVRTRCAAIVDSTIKIDLGPDTNCQMQREQLSALDWTALVFTHSHDDHFSGRELQYVLFPFTDLFYLPFTIYANDAIIDRLNLLYPDWPLDILRIESFTPFVHGEHKITPVQANHIKGEDCFNLLFEKDGKKILYATDTGIWSERTFEFLTGQALDLLIIECTEGKRRSSYTGHLNLEDLTGVLDRCHQSGAITSETQVFTTHHAHTGGYTHAELEEVLAPLGAHPAYDGLILEV